MSVISNESSVISVHAADIISTHVDVIEVLTRELISQVVESRTGQYLDSTALPITINKAIDHFAVKEDARMYVNEFVEALKCNLLAQINQVSFSAHVESLNFDSTGKVTGVRTKLNF